VGSLPCKPYKTVVIKIDITVLTNTDLANNSEAPNEIKKLFINNREPPLHSHTSITEYAPYENALTPSGLIDFHGSPIILSPHTYIMYYNPILELWLNIN
jgi:hypothetical protein